MSDLTSTRWGHACGAVNAQDGSGNREVVAAGDVAAGDNTVEIYSPVDDSWRSGNIDFEEREVKYQYS